MTKPSSALVLCTVGLTSGGSNGILSRSAKTLIGTVNRPFCASARAAGNRNSTASVNDMVRVHGELINHAAIGVWYKPRQCFRHWYEFERPIGDTDPATAGPGRRPSSPACVRWAL